MQVFEQFPSNEKNSHNLFVALERRNEKMWEPEHQDFNTEKSRLIKIEEEKHQQNNKWNFNGLLICVQIHTLSYIYTIDRNAIHTESKTDTEFDSHKIQKHFEIVCTHIDTIHRHIEREYSHQNLLTVWRIQCDCDKSAKCTVNCFLPENELRTLCKSVCVCALPSLVYVRLSESFRPSAVSQSACLLL